MKRIQLSTLIGAGAVTIGALLLSAPAAQAGTDLGADQHLCKALDGTFVTEVFGGQTHSTCTFDIVGYQHHLYYTDGQFSSSN